MVKLFNQFVGWLMGKMNEQFQLNRQWMDGEEQDERFTQRREVYDAMRKSKK